MESSKQTAMMPAAIKSESSDQTATMPNYMMLGSAWMDPEMQTNTMPTEAMPTEAMPTEAKPTETKPTETKPTETKPTGTMPTEAKPTGTMPTEAKPTGTMPTETMPTGTMPTETMPTGTMPTETMPTETMPTGTMPTGTMPTGTMPIGTMPIEIMTAAPEGQKCYNCSVPRTAQGGRFYLGKYCQGDRGVICSACYQYSKRNNTHRPQRLWAKEAPAAAVEKVEPTSSDPINGAFTAPTTHGVTYPKPGYKQCIACAEWQHLKHFQPGFGPAGEWKTCKYCLRQQCDLYLMKNPKTKWMLPLNYDNIYHTSLLHLGRTGRGVSHENAKLDQPRKGPYLQGEKGHSIGKYHKQCIACTLYYPKYAFWNDYGPHTEWKTCCECLERKFRGIEARDNYYHPTLWKRYLGKDYVKGVESNGIYIEDEDKLNDSDYNCIVECDEDKQSNDDLQSGSQLQPNIEHTDVNMQPNIEHTDVNMQPNIEHTDADMQPKDMESGNTEAGNECLTLTA